MILQAISKVYLTKMTNLTTKLIRKISPQHWNSQGEHATNKEESTDH